MNRLRYLRPLLLSGLILMFGSSRAAAYPLLQLDIGGGVYDNGTETITATSMSFTLYAYLTPPPNTTATQLQAMLNKTYYLSAALAPKAPVAGGDYGSFSFNNQTIRATQDMVYGNPPLETFLGGAGTDSGDLAKHDIYDTYFKEFSFQFTALQKTGAYNTQDNAGQGPTPSANGDMYYMAYTVDTSLLATRYTVHFDMYDEVVKKGGDVDINNFAPFSKDAESMSVPEPGSLLLLGSGLAALVARQRRRRSSSTQL